MSGRRGVRSSLDYKQAVRTASNSQWREAEKQAEACEADADAREGYDPNCRFRDHPLHTCVTRDMVLIHPGQDCWYEARAQLADTQMREANDS